MRRSGLFVTTLAILIGCGMPVETLDSNTKAPGLNADPEGDQPPSYNFNPPRPDMRSPPPEEDGGGGGDDDEPNLVPSERGIFFEQTCADSERTRSLRLSNTGDATLRISALSVSGSGFSIRNAPSLPARISAGGHVDLTVVFAPERDTTTPFDGNLRISSNDPGTPTMNIALSGLSLPATVSVTPRSVSFGSVGDGDSRTRRVAVVNESDCAARVDSVRISGDLADNVSAGTLPGRIAPRSTESFEVTLSCDGEDDRLDATMRLRDRNGRSVGSVSLSGTCTD